MAFNLMSLISSVYLLVLITSTTSSITHVEECSALFEFKQSIFHQDDTSTSFSSFHKLDSWIETTVSKSNTSINDHDCCLWDGVVCSSSEGHVIELDLGASSINGSITSNSTLFKLVHLQKLNLSRNNFVKSQIPSEITTLKQLTSLDFYNSAFSGEFPTPIFHLPKLKYLNMSRNHDLVGSLPEFPNNALLESLSLYSTGFFGIIPESISNLKHLVLLDLSRSFFSGSIPVSISNLTQVTILALGFNEFTGPVPSLASLTKLKVLDLSYNNFETKCDYGWIDKLTNLEQLYLDDMNIADEILPSVANLTKLSYFTISSSYIFGGIPTSFTNLTQLTYLDLHDNQLYGRVPSELSNFKNLTFLDLTSNKFNDSLNLDTFFGLNSLQGLFLDGISIVSSENYTDRTLTQLTQLRLSSCELKEFPSFLRVQRQMESLVLFKNKIGGLIPAWILNNSRESMLYIDLSDNVITGFDQHSRLLPWVRLQAIRIYNNLLSGRLPIPPKTIVYYSVSNNKIIGEIPPLICQFESLQFLDLSNNSLTGTLPSCLPELSNLIVLDLNRNKLHGTVTNINTNESQLKMIDLSGNRFTGPLPKSLANCTNLEVLNIGDNSFDGVFPFWLGTLTELQVLILRSNKFFGAIQDSSTFNVEFPKLRIMDLSNNSFSGQLPDKYFKIWKSMKSVYAGNSSIMGFDISIPTCLPREIPYTMTLINKGVKTEYAKILNIFNAIDFSCNSFEGEIPQSLTDLQGLESLNLSNNHLTGYVLPSLGNLKNLESLDLSHNELSGKIPQELLQLGFLAMFNVSFNHLEGRVPSGNQFNTFENHSYVGNPLLCGQPLSIDCQGSTTSTNPHTSDENESFLSGDVIVWVFILTGFGIGLVIGINVGNSVYGRYRSWFNQLYGMRKATTLLE
ncbi:receptor-like protein 49 [Rutidosis leptorrhynchoides]|uniref:receptor-like protein 49 n=1 Tax=Rutidosis leptorrhynchoides TaxID=125765 RepID=UPI003A9A153D